VDPVPDPLLLRKNRVAPGIEPGPLDLYPRTLTTEAVLISLLKQLTEYLKMEIKSYSVSKTNRRFRIR
jgi:hypothetical protein